MNTTEKIKAVIGALNQITINGKRNLDMLLGSIQTLEQVAKELEAKKNEQSD